ncbi:MAG: hypothetical protein DRQ88_02835 [Epsilonproteobacteria bacterium]|nr:MAG: hypothetical protein DRQ89_01790 [Campylobacterota bacterium]RLA67408.1 MAG: hypothetical protein DRQ88_02835 [Campylobacterota bacterium]
MKTIFFLILFLPLQAFSQQYFVFGVTQDLPMGEENEIIRKNYYINIGRDQGVFKGSTLNVFRVISIVHPRETLEKSNFQVKLGELKIVHSEGDRAVGIMKNLIPKKDSPQFDYNDFMIGDVVAVTIRP